MVQNLDVKSVVIVSVSEFMHYLFLEAAALPFYFEEFKKNSSRNVACPLVLLFL